MEINSELLNKDFLLQCTITNRYYEQDLNSKRNTKKINIKKELNLNSSKLINTNNISSNTKYIQEVNNQATSRLLNTLNCNKEYILESGQTIDIVSPGFPQLLPSFTSCLWVVKVCYLFSCLKLYCYIISFNIRKVMALDTLS